MRTLVLSLSLAAAVSAAEPEWTLLWQDDFSRSELGPDWQIHGRGSRTAIVDGRLEICGDGEPR